MEKGTWKARRRQFRHAVRRMAGISSGRDFMSQYHVTDAAAGARLARTDFERLFYAHEGRVIHKWHHYLAIYDQELGGLRDGFPLPNGGTRPLKFLEIGVSKGGSLQLWRKFFGPEATIFGIDIDPACKAADDGDVRVRIGSQADPEFLRSVVAEMGGVDVVLDDGSHLSRHQRVSFDVLFPMLSEGGLYVAEDLHTAYWHKWQGGFRKPGTFIEFAKTLIDDMHAWYHGHPVGVTAAKTGIRRVTFYDSILAIEKRGHEAPFHLKVGQDRDGH